MRLTSPIHRLIRIDKPNGNQQWPACLLVENTIALGVEYKSSKLGKAVWNSGLPKAKGLYLVHASDAKTLEYPTTFFLGVDAISKAEPDLLMRGRALNDEGARQVNEELKAIGSEWSLYARPMHNWNVIPARAMDRDAKESRVLEFPATME